jgi:hypothetical protein
MTYEGVAVRVFGTREKNHYSGEVAQLTTGSLAAVNFLEPDFWRRNFRMSVIRCSARLSEETTSTIAVM